MGQSRSEQDAPRVKGVRALSQKRVRRSQRLDSRRRLLKKPSVRRGQVSRRKARLVAIKT